MKSLSIIILVILNYGCSCSWRLDRAKTKCGYTTEHDTITLRDTIRVPEVVTDTLFRSAPGDTIYVNRDRLHIKYVKLPGDSVYLSGKCDSLIRIVEKKVPFDRVVIQEPGYWDLWHWWYLVVAGIVVLWAWFKR